MRYNVILRIVTHKTISVCAKDEEKAKRTAIKILDESKEVRVKQEDITDVECVSVNEL